MTMPNTIDPELLALMMRRLTGVANAKSSERADARLFRLCTRAVRSSRRIDAVFAAVQLMRDLDKIDRAEAAFILWSLFGQLYWKDLFSPKRKRHPGLARALQEGVELELVLAAATDSEIVRAAAFLREHGEEELAEMVLNQPEEYQALCSEGEGTLVDDKPPEERAAEPVTSPGATQVFSECILAVLATETFREWMPAWQAMWQASKAVAPADAVAAIQNLREIGALTYEESVSLIHRVIDSLIDDALEVDREFRRLDRALDVFQEKHGIDFRDGIADDARPVEWQVLRHRHRRRFNGITAVVLRRFGERRSANLLTRSPKEYDRLCDETVGGERTTGPGV
jgi:hypothetical protein